MGAFTNMSKAQGKGLRGGRLIAKPDDLSGVPTVVAMIPVDGGALAITVKLVNMAEKLFSSKMGARKREWVKGELRNKLPILDIEEKYVDELVSVGLLVTKRHAVVREHESTPDKGRKAAATENEEPKKAVPVDVPETEPDDMPPPGGDRQIG